MPLTQVQKDALIRFRDEVLPKLNQETSWEDMSGWLPCLIGQAIEKGLVPELAWLPSDRENYRLYTPWLVGTIPSYETTGWKAIRQVFGVADIFDGAIMDLDGELLPQIALAKRKIDYHLAA